MSASLGKLNRPEEGIPVGSMWELLLAENADLHHIRPSHILISRTCILYTHYGTNSMVHSHPMQK